MITIDELQVTQRNIRNPEQLARMTAFVKNDGFFTKNCLSKHQSRGKTSPLIEITQFEDGQYFLHDGHHRAAAIVLGGRDFIDGTEYRIRQFTYEQYIKPNLAVEWWTPFDPRIELRLTDTSTYKNMLHKLKDAVPPETEDISMLEEALLHSIYTKRHLYVEPRNGLFTLREFVGSL
jgi:hypothetical protein